MYVGHNCIMTLANLMIFIVEKGTLNTASQLDAGNCLCPTHFSACRCVAFYLSLSNNNQITQSVLK